MQAGRHVGCENCWSPRCIFFLSSNTDCFNWLLSHERISHRDMPTCFPASHTLPHASTPVMTILVTVNSSMPYLLPSRPNPLCLTPPNGAAASLMAPKMIILINESVHLTARG